MDSAQRKKNSSVLLYIANDQALASSGVSEDFIKQYELIRSNLAWKHKKDMSRFRVPENETYNRKRDIFLF